MKRSAFVAFAICATLTFATAVPAQASHSWSTYHWARTANPFTLRLGDNVTGAWDSYLGGASNDWSASSVLNTSVVAGAAGNVKRCNAGRARVEICNAKYGFNGWLGIAGISLSGGHIISGYVKLNDSYFNTSTYNKPEWRRFVTCQEIGHALGLDHTDVNYDNANQGTCMDYTGAPLGPPSNEHPNAHDYDQLQAIYTHTDSTDSTTASAPTGNRSRVVKVDANGNGSITWITWVK